MGVLHKLKFRHVDAWTHLGIDVETRKLHSVSIHIPPSEVTRSKTSAPFPLTPWMIVRSWPLFDRTLNITESCTIGLWTGWDINGD